VPEQLRLRGLAVRAFDSDAMMIGCQLSDGRALESPIEKLVCYQNAAYLHVQYAAVGCCAARVVRV